MAKFLSQVYTVIRGSVGGVTYLAGPHHALIARARVAPVNPASPYQNLIRGFWSQAATEWHGLTATVRRDWDQYALTVQFQSPTGPYTVKGRSLFTSYRMVYWYLLYRAIIGYVNTAAPTDPGALLTPTASDAALGSPGTGRQITINNLNLGRVIAYLELSPIQSSIRNSWKGPFLADTLVGSAIIAPSSSSPVNFTGLVVGGVYFVRIGVMSTGATSGAPVACKVASPLIYRFTATTTV